MKNQDFFFSSTEFLYLTNVALPYKCKLICKLNLVNSISINTFCIILVAFLRRDPICLIIVP